MGEIIGLTASLAGLATFADFIAESSWKIYKISKQLRSAKRDIERFSEEITLFASIILTAHDLLQSYNVDFPQAKLLEYVEGHSLLEQLRQQTRHVYKDIKEVLPRIRSLESSIDWVTRVKWVLSRSEVDNVDSGMKRVERKLHLVIDLVTLARCLEHKDDNLSKIEHLKKQIRILKKRIELGERPQYLQNSPMAEISHSPDNLLLQLAESMAYKETVPAGKSFSRRTDLPREMYNPVISNYGNLSLPIEEEQPTEPAMSSARSTLSDTNTREVDIAISSSDSESQGSRLSSSANTISSTQPTEPGNVDRLPTAREQMAIHGSIYVPPDRWVRTTCIVDRHLGANYMSQNFATRLGLEIYPLNREGAQVAHIITLECGRRIPKIGDVQFQWAKGHGSRKKPFLVNCAICEFNDKPLILGRPFIDSMRREWRESWISDEGSLGDFRDDRQRISNGV